MTDNNQNRLQKLSGSDFEIADNQPDIRRWDLKDSAGKKFGKVDELIFDIQSRKVRYLVADLGKNDFELADKKVLVPIGIGELHKDDDDVILPGVTPAQLRDLPEYDEDDFSASHENSIRNVFGGAGAATLAGTAGNESDFYNHGHFNEDNLYKNRSSNDSDDAAIPVIKEELQVGKREEETGGIRLRSRIVDRDVSKNITLKEEAVNVERTAVNREASASDYEDKEIEVREHAEVPVVSKEARVVEEVSLNKEVTERNEVIKDTLHDTEVDVDQTTSSREKSI